MKSTVSAASFTLLSLATVAVLGCSKPPEHDPNDPRFSRTPPFKMATPFIVPADSAPTVHPVATADLPADAKIIGVIIGGKPRAYALQALKPVNRHVVNDVFAGVPVSVTYCDQKDCVKVFTDESQNKPLDIKSAGYIDGMLLQVNGVIYYQQNGVSTSATENKQFPFVTMDHQRMSFGEWRTAHPDSDIYLGVVEEKEPDEEKSEKPTNKPVEANDKPREINEEPLAPSGTENSPKS